MRARTRLILCAGTAATIALAGAPGASASFVVKSNQARLDGTHGYLIRVESSEALVKGKSSGSVDISAYKRPAFAVYSATGTQSAKVMKVDLGDFGKVDLTFHPKKRTHPKPPPGCTGTVKKIVGVWKGKIKFRGEGGYTKVSADSAPGYHRVTDLDCHSGGSGNNKISLFSYKFQDPTTTGFTAVVGKKAGSKPAFQGQQSTVLGDVAIFREAFLKGKPSQFTYNDALTQATVHPPAPFRGTGTFDNPDWSGNLRVKLPGAGVVPLTGPGFTAGLGMGLPAAHTALP
jgi:hypothetical protein